MVLVTHHVEEVPPGFTHAMLMRRGTVLAAGPVEQVFTARNLSRCFGVPLIVERRAARWTAHAAVPIRGDDTPRRPARPVRGHNPPEPPARVR
jgi:ABC-type cobalamin/Fe3+-siderophores transport system ATPase subunit